MLRFIKIIAAFFYPNIHAKSFQQKKKQPFFIVLRFEATELCRELPTIRLQKRESEWMLTTLLSALVERPMSIKWIKDETSGLKTVKEHYEWSLRFGSRWKTPRSKT